MFAIYAAANKNVFISRIERYYSGRNSLNSLNTEMKTEIAPYRRIIGEVPVSTYEAATKAVSCRMSVSSIKRTTRVSVTEP